MSITDITTTTTGARRVTMKMLKGVLLAFFLTSTMLAQKESLLIGPGDEVEIEVFDTPDLDQNARVTDTGEFPLILGGTGRLASLTPIETARPIEAALIHGDVRDRPQVLVTLTQYATQS